MNRHALRFSLLLVVLWAMPTTASDLLDSLKKGTIELRSSGPLAFGPEGILFVGDPLAATVYAVDTQDRSAGDGSTNLSVSGIDAKIAGALGASADNILINDLAVNPISGTPYLSVTRGRGPDGQAVILKIASDGSISELSLKDVNHASSQLPNAPDESVRDRRGQSQRIISITDISLIDDKLVVAGLSNEEFSSNLRAIPFPFSETPDGTALEVYHGAHGKLETHSPVRTFTTISIDNEPFVVAAYTCTPLVRFPLKSLEGSEKIRGTTVAELGNRNQPLDMFVYKKDGAEYILMCNSSRGTMKISTENIGRSDGIVERISGTAGQTYDTIESWAGVVQLDRLGDAHACVVIKNEDGTLDLKAVPLP